MSINREHGIVEGNKGRLMDFETLKQKYKDQILDYAHQHHIADVKIFGSTARKQATKR